MICEGMRPQPNYFTQAEKDICTSEPVEISYRLPPGFIVKGKKRPEYWGDELNDDYTSNKTYGTADGLSKYRQGFMNTSPCPDVYKEGKNELLPRPLEYEMTPTSNGDKNVLPFGAGHKGQTSPELRNYLRELYSTTTYQRDFGRSSDEAKRLVSQFHAQKQRENQEWKENRSEYLKSMYPHLCGLDQHSISKPYSLRPPQVAWAEKEIERLQLSEKETEQQKYDVDTENDTITDGQDNVQKYLHSVVQQMIKPEIGEPFYLYKYKTGKTPFIVDDANRVFLEQDVIRRWCTTNPLPKKPGNVLEAMRHNRQEQTNPDPPTQWNRKVRFKYEPFDASIVEPLHYSPGSNPDKAPRPQSSPLYKGLTKGEAFRMYADQHSDVVSKLLAGKTVAKQQYGNGWDLKESNQNYFRSNKYC